MGNIKSVPDNQEQQTISKFSHFPSEDVSQWLAAFQKAFPQGFVTQVELEKIFKDLFPFGSCSVFTKFLFKTINISSTQKIDFSEMLIAFSILAKGSKYEKLRWIFRFYDIDNDGVVSRNDMYRVAQSLYDMIGYFFDLEVNVKNLVNELFDELENESGFLTFEDFKNLAVKKPEIIKKLTYFEDIK